MVASAATQHDDDLRVTQMIALSSVDPEESLRSYKLLEAFHTGDTEVISKLLEIPTKNTLHLAVRTSPRAVVELVLSLCPRQLNSIDSKGQTPLHIAAILNRAEILDVLLARSDIDDTIRDSAGCCASDLASSHTLALITASRVAYQEEYLHVLSSYVSSTPAEGALSHKRLSAQFSSGSPKHGHSASFSTPSPPVSTPPTPVTSMNSTLPTFAISAASGHVSNVAAERLYHFIVRPKFIDFSAQESASGTTILHEATSRNDLGIIKLVVAKGGDVLIRDRKGRTPIDICKDDRIKAVLTESISRKQDNNGKAPVMKGYLSKWTNMARGYRSRWFVLNAGILSYYRHPDDEGKASKGSISMSVAEIHTRGNDLKFEISSNLGKAFGSFWLKGNHHAEVARWIEALRQNIEFARGTKVGGVGLTRSVSTLSTNSRNLQTSSSQSMDGASLDEQDSILGDDDTTDNLPRSDDFDLLATSASTQLDLTEQLILSLKVGTDEDLMDAVKGSISSCRQFLAEFIDVTAQRERYLKRQLDREKGIKKLWENNMKELASSHSLMEEELAKVGKDNIRKKRALQEVRATLLISPVTTPLNLDGIETPDPLSTPTTPRMSTSSDNLRTRNGRMRGATIIQPLNPAELESLVISVLDGEEELEDDEDEFFEALDSGIIPLDDGLPTAVTTGGNDNAQAYLDTLDTVPYKGYEHLREKLPIESDNRPPVSLWAILKGSIGKDLTKISFPVFFNEPTSMLQRMSEDMEFSDCLDNAVAERDPTKRIAHVAAFAMSNYSSTIGRIAKPFNPMLSETFEYVNIKKSYRYIGEQVSHHPPISAAIAQSPNWEFLCSTDAKSKFTGKSFEITPVGIASVTLRIPQEWDPSLPPAKGKFPGMVEEKYSWKKVTTSVSNLLFTPIIDHFGEMTVTHSRTGLQCILTFKPRGWRGSGTVISGKVVDSAGHQSWEIAGKWSDQLVARQSDRDEALALNPDSPIPLNDSTYVRLWKNSIKPTPPLPFNLTPFAATLNDTNEELKFWLPQTDCRLRPDQHAFEHGNFDEANALKSALEDHQRSTRKAKEQRGEVHRPRWFKRTLDSDYREYVWEPVMTEEEQTGEGNIEYWIERNRVGVAKRNGGEETKWNNVDPIFI